MKKLTYILLFIWNIGIGQEIGLQTFYYDGVNWVKYNPKPYYDTVMAVFMICDTSINSFYQNAVYWRRGYVVNKYKEGELISSKHLDESQKPFSKQIIIWDYKKIE